MSDVTLDEVIDNMIANALAQMNTFIPGRFESYDISKAKCTVQPLIKRVYLNGDELELPVLAEVPVVFNRTQKTAITYPINKGDMCIIGFSQRALENWKSSNGEIVTPGDTRKFDLSDSFAIPGLFSFGFDNNQPNNEDLFIKHEGQTITVKKSGDIEIGGSSLKALVTEDFKSVFDNHTHNFVAAPSGTFATSSPTTLTPTTDPIAVPPGVPGTFGSALNELTDKVKAQ